MKPPASPSPALDGFCPKLANKARLRFDRHAGQHMIIYPERGLALNESAAMIARRLDGTQTIGQIVHELVRDSDPAYANDIYNDVVELITELSKKGLLEMPMPSSGQTDDDPAKTS